MLCYLNLRGKSNKFEQYEISQKYVPQDLMKNTKKILYDIKMMDEYAHVNHDANCRKHKFFFLKLEHPQAPSLFKYYILEQKSPKCVLGIIRVE